MPKQGIRVLFGSLRRGVGSLRRGTGGWLQEHYIGTALSGPKRCEQGFEVCLCGILAAGRSDMHADVQKRDSWGTVHSGDPLWLQHLMSRSPIHQGVQYRVLRNQNKSREYYRGRNKCFHDTVLLAACCSYTRNLNE